MNKKKVTRIRNERENITTNLTEIKRILKEYYEQVHANKLDILDEMGKFLERHKWLKLTQNKIKNLNGPMTSEEIELVVNYSQ